MFHREVKQLQFYNHLYSIEKGTNVFIQINIIEFIFKYIFKYINWLLRDMNINIFFIK